MIDLKNVSPFMTRSILDRMGSTGQPPERGALLVNVATTPILEVLRDEYLRPMKATKRNSTFKLVQAPFGGGKTQFLHCLRELAWDEGFSTSLVGLSPRECPFDRPVLIFKEVARRIEMPVADLEEEPSPGIDVVLRQIAEARIAAYGTAAFSQWLVEDFSRANIESRAYLRAVRAYLEAICNSDLDTAETLGDYLRGDTIPSNELEAFRLRERLDDTNAFRWLRSMVQVLSALDLPGVVLLFDEMDRNMSMSVKRRRDIGDNLRQMIDYCGQALLPGVVWCYAVPPEFMTTIVPEYPALAQRLKGAAAFSAISPLQPLIDLDRLPLGATETLEQIGLKLLSLSAHAYEDGSLSDGLQRSNIHLLAREFGNRQLESGTRRQFVKAVVSMLEAQRRDKEFPLDAKAIEQLCSSVAEPIGEAMPDEMDF